MRQIFMHLIPSDSQLAKLTKRLEAAAFLVAPSQRAVGGIHVRVRTETGDEAEVERIVAEAAPGTRRGPSGAPTMDIKGYREERWSGPSGVAVLLTLRTVDQEKGGT